MLHIFPQYSLFIVAGITIGGPSARRKFPEAKPREPSAEGEQGAAAPAKKTLGVQGAKPPAEGWGAPAPLQNNMTVLITILKNMWLGIEFKSGGAGGRRVVPPQGMRQRVLPAGFGHWPVGLLPPVC